MIHEKKKDIPCEECGAMFSIAIQLSKHKQLYHLPKFKCEFPNCFKSYISKALLQQHKNKHLGIRNHSCHLCEKSYFNVKDLQRHLDVVHKQTTYFCEICSYTNNRKDYLGNHLKSAHSIDAAMRSEMLKRVKFIKNSV